jgi:hypothetical protein
MNEIIALIEDLDQARKAAVRQRGDERDARVLEASQDRARAFDGRHVIQPPRVGCTPPWRPLATVTLRVCLINIALAMHA